MMWPLLYLQAHASEHAFVVLAACLQNFRLLLFQLDEVEDELLRRLSAALVHSDDRFQCEPPAYTDLSTRPRATISTYTMMGGNASRCRTTLSDAGSFRRWAQGSALRIRAGLSPSLPRLRRP